VKKPVKLDPDKPCPICGGVIWVLEDRIICGWCGKEEVRE
jgi:ribosomal protein S27AE